jgi:ABC-type bacteriocin/lantibiotic exporter with double-glycine peptidase domain
MKPFLFKSILKANLGWFFLIGTVMLYRGISSLFMPAYSKYVFDAITGKDVSIERIVGIGIIVLLGTAIGVLVQNLVIDLFTKKVLFELNNRFIKSLLTHRVQKIVEIGDGKILNNFSQDINAVSGMIRSAVELIRIPVEMIIAAVYLFYTNTFLALIVILLLPPVTLTGKLIGNSLDVINKKYLSESDKQIKIINRVLKAITVIKAYASEHLVENDFTKISLEKYNLDRKQVKYNSFFAGLIDLCMGSPFTVIFILSAILFKSRNITAGTLTLFLQLLNKITVPFVRFNTIMIQYKQTRVSFERLNDILITETPPHYHDPTRGEEPAAAQRDSPGDKINLPGLIGSIDPIDPISPIKSIKFDNVCFKYEDRLIINSLNAFIGPGKHYGIIGENGSGKTTFLKLILNILPPLSGGILYNNIDQNSLSFYDIRKANMIVYVEDNPCVLFDDFEKNIILDSPKDESRFIEVLQMVGLLDYRGELTTKSAEELSAGQKQRVALARGLYHIKNESVLVLDEPFSAIDARGIKEMYHALDLLREKYNLTILEITHNLAALEKFDEIFYFEQGRIILAGNHSALMKHEQYSKYVLSQKPPENPAPVSCKG